MNLLKCFQKIKWDILAKKNPNYYVFSDDFISKDEEKYRESGKNDFKKFILKDKELMNFLEKSQEKTCLEFGSGNGIMTEFFAEIFSKVYAVDISEEMIESAKKRLYNIKNINYIKDSEEKIALLDNSVDFIFSYAVLQHFLNKKMVKERLMEFHRIMKYDAVAKIQIRGYAAYGGIFRYFKWYYGVSFSKKKILDILKKTGFEVINIQGDKTKLFWLLIRKI